MGSQSREILNSLFGSGGREIGIPNTHGLLGKVRRAKEAAQDNELILPDWEELLRGRLQSIGKTKSGVEWHYASGNKRVSDGIFAQLGSDEIIAVGYTIHRPETKVDPNMLEVSRIRADEHGFVPMHTVIFFNFRGAANISPEECLHVAGLPDFSNGQLAPALKDFLTIKTINHEVTKMLRDALNRFDKGKLRTIDIREVIKGTRVVPSLLLHPFQEKIDDPPLT